MGSYLIRRLLLVIPTLWAIITINFFIVQIAPGGPVDQAIAAIEFGQHGGMPGAGGGGAPAMPAPAPAISARGTIAGGAASIRKSSPRSPTATASTNRCTSAT
jgi:ABC-type microcin C transport system permease subunit YejB